MMNDSSSERMPDDDTVRAWALLMRVSRQMLERVESALKEAGLPPLVWYDVLHELAGAGEAGLRPGQLISSMLLAQYNLSRLLYRMEKEGLIARSAVEGDGRAQMITATPEGLRVRRAMWVVYGRQIGMLVGDRLSEAETKALSNLLLKLRLSAD